MFSHNGNVLGCTNRVCTTRLHESVQVGMRCRTDVPSSSHTCNKHVIGFELLVPSAGWTRSGEEGLLECKLLQPCKRHR